MAAVTVIGGVVAVAGVATGWLSIPVALAVLLGGVVLGLLLLARRRRAAHLAPAGRAEAAERLWRRADGPWPVYDRRRSVAGELPAAPEPQRDRQTTE